MTLPSLPWEPPPARLYHRTRRKNWRSISAVGLQPGFTKGTYAGTAEEHHAIIWLAEAGDPILTLMVKSYERLEVNTAQIDHSRLFRIVPGWWGYDGTIPAAAIKR